jgi:hypothetical protein
MLRQIKIEVETPGDSRTMFGLRIDANVIAERLTAAQTHLLIGEILDRIALPKPGESVESSIEPASHSSPPPVSSGGPQAHRLQATIASRVSALLLAVKRTQRH